MRVPILAYVRAAWVDVRGRPVVCHSVVFRRWFDGPAMLAAVIVVRVVHGACWTEPVEHDDSSFAILPPVVLGLYPSFLGGLARPEWFLCVGVHAYVLRVVDSRPVCGAKHFLYRFHIAFFVVHRSGEFDGFNWWAPILAVRVCPRG